MKNANTMNTGLTISGGLYLVIDPSPGAVEVLPKVEAAIRGGVKVLQIWNNWSAYQDVRTFVQQTCFMAHKNDIPVLINGDVNLLRDSPADGIHYDEPQATPEELRKELNRPILYGITCGNDLSKIHWAVEHNVDYISFCAMYPSPSVDTCDIVSLDTVRTARKLTSVPIFASGGITPENAIPVLEHGADGIAVISGILKAENPMSAALRYRAVIESVIRKRTLA